MRALCLHSKRDIEAVLRRNPALNVYSIGDLDDFFWERTTWYGLAQGDRVEQLALVYAGPGTPTLLVFADGPGDAARELLRSLVPLLPGRIYAHLSVGLSDALRPAYEVESHGSFHKMALTDLGALARADASGAERLGPPELPQLEALYREAYPGNWFDPRMLETGYYFGIREGGRLASAAGVHVFSREYRVAALGNITTHPSHRGHGLAGRATAALCRALLEEVDSIGLNVKADNATAIACYARLGFQRIADYEECVLTAKPYSFTGGR